ncbi:hypothetical protein PIB30_009675 [Stylosanthes scabra]|uniref:Uncharacterized protein n=1 Tax=Stylosanthes scabra TaxID=79078 RepID=A0ABU6U654_9FABA|nr:hypothetical protein [Stylosanthes scabra]
MAGAPRTGQVLNAPDKVADIKATKLAWNLVVGVVRIIERGIAFNVLSQNLIWGLQDTYTGVWSLQQEKLHSSNPWQRR